jgi:cytochrome P450
MIEAGSETTSSSLNSCMKYLAANPDVQRRAHEELATVIGDSRSPTFDDEASLPYIRAIVKEILRMRPVAQVGIPHLNTVAVTYKDYYIPANTIISINQYAIHFDPKMFPDPMAFKPDRYLNHPHRVGVYAAAADPNERDHYAFGAGRRICPGMHLAENSIFIVLAKVLWGFSIHGPLAPTGVEEELDTSDLAYEPGMMTVPKRYKLRFLPVNEERERVMKEEWANAKREGFYLGDVKVDEQGMVA